MSIHAKAHEYSSKKQTERIQTNSNIPKKRFIGGISVIWLAHGTVAIGHFCRNPIVGVQISFEGERVSPFGFESPRYRPSSLQLRFSPGKGVC